jgi:hypothetical protein
MAVKQSPEKIQAMVWGVRILGETCTKLFQGGV